MKNDDVTLSICCVTYNQEDFIQDTLKGFECQEANFRIEIVIYDDCSTDSTRTKLIKFKKISQHDVKLIFAKENRYSKGDRIFPKTFKEVRGKYIALCEGDDYWTDPLKLQKQVDFLKRNDDYGICFHNVKQLNTYDFSNSKLIPSIYNDLDFSIEDYILDNKTATCSMVFKNQCLGLLPNWFFKLPFGDLGIILVIMKNSNKKARVLKDVMSVYRLHDKGVHGAFHQSNKLLIKAYKQHIQFIKIIEKKLLFEQEYKKYIVKKYINTYAILINLNKQEKNIIEYFKFKFLNKFYNLKYGSEK